MEPVSMALGAGSVLSSLFGMFGGGNDAQKYVDDAVAQLVSVSIPDPAQQKIALERYRSAGELDPRLEAAIKQDPSAFESIVKNTKYSQAQNRALSELQSLGEEGGLSLSDKADLQDQMIANANKDKGNRAAITDEMARRGQLGSGMELQAQLAGAQDSGDRDAQTRLRALGGAQDRAMDAIIGAGDLAGKLENQDYQQKSDLATARDRIAAFNTENARGVQQRNVGAENAAAGTNLQNKQTLWNSNADMANKEQQYNKELEQQRFENDMKKRGAIADAYSGAAAQANKADQNRRTSFGGIASGLGQMGTAYQNQSNWDEWMKKTKGGRP